MKLINLFIITFLLVSGCSNNQRPAVTDSWAEVLQNNRGTVVLHYVPSEGFSYADEDGRITGVTIELFRDFVNFAEETYDVELNLELNSIERFTDFYNTVVEGVPGEFGVANVTITEERRNELAFSPFYLKNIAVLITHSTVQEIDELANARQAFPILKGLAFEGTLHETRIREIKQNYLPGLEIEFAHSNNEIIERVSGGNHYFSYVDIYNYWRAKEQGADIRRHSTGDDPGEMFGIIMPHGSDWQQVMDEFFEHDGGYIHSERYREILQTHLGEELARLLSDAL